MQEDSAAFREPAARLQGSDAIHDTILDICLALISGATKCRCVGIRVEKEGDFPLVRWLGFSERFVELERSLLPKEIGEEISIEDRLALLECMCGRVIRGERIGCEELFSPGGSLCWNDLSDRKKISPDILKKERAACRDEGFRSLALVPCRPDDQTLGLLHVCDTRRGLLSKTLLANLEEAGRHFAHLIFQLRELQRIESQPREVESRPLSVLVVDDEVEMASLVGDMLEAKGHHVTIAFSGPGAIELLTERKVDLVITDFNMPLMSGLGLASEIWTRWHPYAPPVILMSGTSGKEMAIREKPLPDVAALLSKPFTVETLMDAVHAALH